MAMTGPRQSYSSYLLRLWLTPSGGGLVLRASLESAQTGERVGFTSLDELSDFLQRQTGAAPDTREGQDVGQKRGCNGTTTKQIHPVS